MDLELEAAPLAAAAPLWGNPHTPASADSGGPGGSTAAPHEPTTWRSCCMTIDRQAALFFSQLVVGVAVIGFCIGMLVANRDCDTFGRWGPLLTFVVGVFLPAPQLLT